MSYCDYPTLNYKHENQANSPPLQNIKDMVWNEVEKELQFLDHLLRVNNKNTDSDPPFSYPFSSP